MMLFKNYQIQNLFKKIKKELSQQKEILLLMSYLIKKKIKK
jgi:hypothetical protein